MRHGQKHPNFSKLVVGLTVYKSLIRIPFFGRLVLLFGVFRLCMLVTYRRRTAAPCDSKRIARPRDLLLRRDAPGISLEVRCELHAKGDAVYLRDLALLVLLDCSRAIGPSGKLL